MSLINKCRAFWRFEEESDGNTAVTREDSTGRGNDWTAEEVPSGVPNKYPPHTTGVIGNGVRFQTANLGRLRQAERTDLEMTPDQAFTVAGWFNVTGETGTRVPLIEKYASWGLGLQESGTSGIFQFWLYQADLSPDRWHKVEVTVPNYASSGWHYVRGWHDPDEDTINLQVDCGTIASEAHTAGVANNSEDIYMGQILGYGGGSFSADALGIWWRVLDTGEAEALCDGLEYPFGLCGYLAFGDYEFPSTFHAADDNLDWLIPSIKAGRRHGGHSLAATLREKRLTVRGGIVKGPVGGVTILRDEIDELREALAGQPQNLYFEPDRYWRNVRVEMFRNPYGPTHYCRIADGIEILFVASDPFQYAFEESTDTWTAPTNGATRTITAGGNAYAHPTIDVTVGGAGAQSINFTIENTTTGESFTLAGDVTGGQEITVDTLDQTVKIGTTDEIDLFDGQFLRMDVGDNVFEVTITSGSITSIVMTWRSRWY